MTPENTAPLPSLDLQNDRALSLAAKAERARYLDRRRALDPFQPNAVFVERERTHTGTIANVATVLLRNRECPWRCIYCDLWKDTTLSTVPGGAIVAQLDFALQKQEAANAEQIKLYNAGSFFDPRAIPASDHADIAARLNTFQRVIVECHPALVHGAVTFRDLLRGAKLEIAMGLEAADDVLLARLQRRMKREQFRSAAAFLREHDIAVRAFIIVKPPFIRGEDEAVTLAARSIDFAFECGAEVVTLIPSRFGPVQLDALAAAGEFSPPMLATVEAAMDHGVASRRGRTFVDLWDAARISGCASCKQKRIERLAAMNLSQDLLPAVSCRC